MSAAVISSPWRDATLSQRQVSRRGQFPFGPGRLSRSQTPPDGRLSDSGPSGQSSAQTIPPQGLDTSPATLGVSVSIAASPSSPRVGESVTLTAAIVDAPARSSPSYNWEIGTGGEWSSFGTNSTLSFLAGQPESWTFRVTVSYDNGESATSAPLTVVWTEEEQTEPEDGSVGTSEDGGNPAERGAVGVRRGRLLLPPGQRHLRQGRDHPGYAHLRRGGGRYGRAPAEDRHGPGGRGREVGRLCQRVRHGHPHLHPQRGRTQHLHPGHRRARQHPGPERRRHRVEGLRHRRRPVPQTA